MTHSGVWQAWIEWCRVTILMNVERHTPFLRTAKNYMMRENRTLAASAKHEVLCVDVACHTVAPVAHNEHFQAVCH